MAAETRRSLPQHDPAEHRADEVDEPLVRPVDLIEVGLEKVDVVLEARDVVAERSGVGAPVQVLQRVDGQYRSGPTAKINLLERIARYEHGRILRASATIGAARLACRPLHAAIRISCRRQDRTPCPPDRPRPSRPTWRGRNLDRHRLCTCLSTP